MSRLRVGLLGCGGIAGRHAAAVAQLPHQVELVACCGRDAERTAAFAGSHGAAAYTDLDEMLDGERLDLVIVTLPPSARAGVVERIARAGVHLLAEKPLALDLRSAGAMVEAADAADVVAAVGFMYRFGDAVRAWKAAETGRVGLYVGSYHCNSLHAPWWRGEAKSGGQIVEQVIHQIDLIRHLMGDPDTVYARRSNLFHRDVPGYDIVDVSAVVFGWDDGSIATLNASNIAVPGIWDKRWEVYAARLIGRFTGWNEAVFTRTDGESGSLDISGNTDPFVAQLADVHRAIMAGDQPSVPLAEGVSALKLALAARRSAAERREIRLVE